MNDAQLLADIPEFLSIGQMLKATPSTEGARRFLFLEASNEGTDQQGEVVAAKALAESADYFKRYGNVDIEHYTLLGKPDPTRNRPGFPGAELYEIGRPVDVRQTGKTTFVKAEIYSGDTPVAANANTFWQSIADVSPPHRWYPSVAGSIPKDGKQVVIDSTTKMRKAIITKVRWTNIGMSKTPVNQHVPAGATLPFGAFVKAWGPGGLDLAKALEAGYGSDSATLTGGAALRQQSLDTRVANYHDFREQMAADLRSGAVGANPGVHAMAAHAATKFALSPDEAAEWVERFMRDLKTGLTKRSKQ